MFLDQRLLTALAVGGIAAAALVWHFARGNRTSPEERERMRRLKVNGSRRWIEGEVAEADESVIHYSYEFRGVTYSASQDVSALKELLPADPALLIGRLVTVKFDPVNPANSIVLCEEWSGLPAFQRGPAADNSKET